MRALGFRARGVCGADPSWGRGPELGAGGRGPGAGVVYLGGLAGGVAIKTGGGGGGWGRVVFLGALAG